MATEPQRDDFPRDLRGGYDYWKALAIWRGDEIERLRAENQTVGSGEDPSDGR